MLIGLYNDGVFRENDLRIFQRTKEKLKKIKEQIYTYLISPKDAFYQVFILRIGRNSRDLV